MISVVVFGNKDDLRQSSAIERALSRFGDVEYDDGYTMRRTGENVCFIVHENSHLRRIDEKNTILIFKNNTLPSKKIIIGDRVTAIFDSSDMNAVNILSRQKLCGISCGMSPRDTLTLTSNSFDTAVVSVQREFTDFSGGTIETQELVIKLSKPEEPYTILSVCAVLLLTGCTPTDGGYLI